MAYLISLDSGTTSVRALLYNEKAEVLSMAQMEISQSFPQPGWVEEDPEEIWEKQLQVMRQVMEEAHVEAKEISGVGITNQRETVIAWDRDSARPIYPAIVWQDRRTEGRAEDILQRGLKDWFVSRTGLIPNAYFSGTKIWWILQSVPGAREKMQRGELCFGTIDTWLLYKATQGASFATDYSNASRTMLFNLNTKSWDEEILEYFSLTKECLPAPQESGSLFGAFHESYFGVKIPITAMMGDQQSALFGQLCFEKTEAKCTYGTGAFILSNIGKTPVVSKKGLLTTVAWGFGGEVYYALEGSIFMAGAAVQWLRDNLGIIRHAAESEKIASAVPDTAGVYFLSTFQGLGAPWWDNGRTASIVGMTRKTTAAHIVRAALESVAYRVKDVVAAMEHEMCAPCKFLKVDGGMSANAFLMQFQSDMLQIPVIRPAFSEATALGAMLMAGLGCGVFQSKEEIRTLFAALEKENAERYGMKTIYPKMPLHRAAPLYEGWLDQLGVR